MLIKDLFTKPVSRPINGVIKADQFDNESVWQELDEYVITRELDIHLRNFISAYLESVDNKGNTDIIGKVGIWVRFSRFRQVSFHQDPVLPAGKPRSLKGRHHKESHRVLRWKNPGCHARRRHQTSRRF